MSVFRSILLASVALSSLPALAQSAALPEDAAADGADAIIVTGRVQRLYRVEETTVGKAAEDPMNIPQAVQVINSELFADQGARDATDIYRNISGVSAFSYAGITFRGFRQDQSFYDGQRGNPFIGFSVPQLFNIERVEVLKGPSGLFFGPGSPGGIINYVSKRPSDTRSLRMVLTGGNYNRVGISAEATGPIDANGIVTYRLASIRATSPRSAMPALRSARTKGASSRSRPRSMTISCGAIVSAVSSSMMPAISSPVSAGMPTNRATICI